MLPSAAAPRRLLAHDIRLAWRDFRSTFRLLDDKALAVLMLVLLLVMHAAAWSIGGFFGDTTAPGGEMAALRRAVPGVAFVMLLMTAQTLNSITKTLYGRGDLDLLLSSPFPVRTILLVRGLAVALGAAASAAIFVVPVADVGLLHGEWRCFALIPTLAAGALAATAASLTLAMVLFAVLGPRRTRLCAQIIATFVGGGFMIGLQLGHVVPGLGLPDGLQLSRMPPGIEASLLLPVRASLGDGWALGAWLALAIALYVACTLGFGHRFALGVVAASSAPQVKASRRSSNGRERGFDTRLGAALRAKEWRLLRRDPWILSQLLLQVLYMTPMLAMVWSGAGPGRSLSVALAPMIVVVAYQVTASMTWLSLSGEDAPDLLATAPVTRRSLHLGKLLAVAQVTAALAVIPLLWLATLDWRAASVTVVLAAAAVCMAMTLSSWHSKTAKRSSFAARHRESKLLALLEMVMSMLLGLTAAIAAVGSVWACLPLALAGTILAVNRPRRPGRKMGDRPHAIAPSADADRAAGRQPGQQAA